VAKRNNYFLGLLRPGSPTITDIADNMQVVRDRLERFVSESPWKHENVLKQLQEHVPEVVYDRQAAVMAPGSIQGAPVTVQPRLDVGIIAVRAAVIDQQFLK